MRIAEVAFNLPLERTFHYLLPAELAPIAQAGVRVLAPFGPRERIGCILRVLADSPIPHLKSVRRVLDPVPVINGERWELAAWLAAHYGCSLGEALALMVPSALRLPRRDESLPPAAAAIRAPRPVLTAHQRQALRAIQAALDEPASRVLLLHGVTASGKTQLYLEAIDHVLRQGRSAICLIPEIALTPQTIDRFRAWFQEEVAVWHSRLTARQRALEWVKLAQGRCRIVVGARSAVFAPVQRLGLIILDEEHDSSYKQEDSPRYHTRTVARARARLAKAGVLLGSATPSIESYYATRQGEAQLLQLPERVEGRTLPPVELIDLREELASRHRAGPLSLRLIRLLQQTIERGEQTMLLLNRRGFARTAQCPACGIVERCRSCSVPLIYHAGERALICHYCNFRETPEELCRHCRKGYLRFRGSGTERVESELHRLFPGSAVARMDYDTTRQRESHRRVYEAVKSRQVQVLVGTQMIAKGLDFPSVTLVGVISADTSLNLPDFRAGERTFDLLTQVAGRAGRGERSGRVVIQTFCPQHYAIQAACQHDYRRFYEAEIRMRRQLKLPPFADLVELTVQGARRQRVEEAAEQLAASLRRAIRGKRISLLGPAPHRIPRLRRTYRTCLLLKGPRAEAIGGLLRTVLQPGRKFRGLPVIVNVDPQ